MLRKTAVMGAAAALLLGLLFGRSNLATTVGVVRQHVKDSVPVDFELKRARQMIKDLRPEIEKNLRLIAQEEVEVAKLERHVGQADENLVRARTEILRLREDLTSGTEMLVYGKRTYTPQQVETDLASRFDEYKTQEATTGALKKILMARQRSLQAARDKLDGMLDAKRQLEVDVENLEARLAMVEVAQTTSDFNFDDSQLSRTRELIDEIGTRIEVAERLVNADTSHFDRIPLDEPTGDRQITDEVAEYFLPQVETVAESD